MSVCQYLFANSVFLCEESQGFFIHTPSCFCFTDRFNLHDFKKQFLELKRRGEIDSGFSGFLGNIRFDRLYSISELFLETSEEYYIDKNSRRLHLSEYSCYCHLEIENRVRKCLTFYQPHRSCLRRSISSCWEFFICYLFKKSLIRGISHVRPKEGIFESEISHWEN